MGPVTDGHEVSGGRSALQDQYAHRILSEIAGGHPISQRRLANELGIALGMTNLLLRRLVRRGLVRISRVRANRVAYFLTPAGVAEKTRMSRDIFQRSVRLYASARDRVRAAFEDVSREWPVAGATRKPVIFLGTGETSEIAFVCLQETDLELVAVIDFQGRARFFGVPVFAAVPVSAALRDLIQKEAPLFMAFTDAEQNQTFLTDAGIAAEQVRWI